MHIALLTILLADGGPAPQPFTLPPDLWTTASFVTLTGAAGITFIIANVIQYVFNYNPRWLALAIAMGVALGGVYLTGGHGGAYIIGFLNGFYIFWTALGATLSAGVLAGKLQSPPPTSTVHIAELQGLPSQLASPRRRLFEPWL